eukprot:COSAG02_NODE_4969_length_4772_cov_2.562166_1_plen_1390_part_00
MRCRAQPPSVWLAAALALSLGGGRAEYAVTDPGDFTLLAYTGQVLGVEESCLGNSEAQPPTTDYGCVAAFSCNSPPCTCLESCVYTAPVTHVPQYATCDDSAIFALQGTLVDGSDPALGADSHAYVPAIDCARTISVPAGLQLALTVQALSLGGVGAEGDRLDIHDGPNASMPLLRRLEWHSVWSGTIYSSASALHIRFVTEDVEDDSDVAADGGDRNGFALSWSSAPTHSETPSCAPEKIVPKKWLREPVSAADCAQADLSAEDEAASRIACETGVAGEGACEYVPALAGIAESCTGTATNQVNTPVCSNTESEYYVNSQGDRQYGTWSPGSPEDCTAGTANTPPCTCAIGCTYTPPRAERAEACAAVAAAQAGVYEARNGAEFGLSVSLGKPTGGAGSTGGMLLAASGFCPSGTAGTPPALPEVEGCVQLYEQELVIDSDDRTACAAADLTGGTVASAANCAAAALPGGTCVYTAAECSGIATEVAATCSGMATGADAGKQCDLDAVTDGAATCWSGCDSTDAFIPDCDLDASTDGRADCPDGCTAVVERCGATEARQHGGFTSIATLAAWDPGEVMGTSAPVGPADAGGTHSVVYSQFAITFTESQNLPRRAFGASSAFDGNHLLVGDPLLDVWKVESEERCDAILPADAGLCSSISSTVPTSYPTLEAACTSSGLVVACVNPADSSAVTAPGGQDIDQTGCVDDREPGICQTGSCPNPADGDVSSNIDCGAVGMVSSEGCGGGTVCVPTGADLSVSSVRNDPLLCASGAFERNVWTRNIFTLLAADVQCGSTDTALSGGTAVDATACAEACIAQEGCAYFTFGKAGAAGVCHMEGAVDDTCSVDGTSASVDHDFYKIKQNTWTQKCTYTPEVGNVEYNHGGAWMYTRNAISGVWESTWNMAGEASLGPDGLMRAASLFSDGVNSDQLETRAGHSVALLGDTAAVGIEMGSTRLRIYARGAGSTWTPAAAFTDDDLCPGGSSTSTGWRYVECLKRSTTGVCVTNQDATMCPDDGPHANIRGCGVCLQRNWQPTIGCTLFIAPTCHTSGIAVHDDGNTVLITAEAFAWDSSIINVFSWPTRLLNVIRKHPSTDVWAVEQQVVVSSATVSLQLPGWQEGDEIRKDRMLNDFGAGGVAVAGDLAVIGSPAWGGAIPDIDSGRNTGTPAVYTLEFQCALGWAYEITPATTHHSAVCAFATVCTASQYESVAPTRGTDRECSELTVCANGQFEDTPPTAISDRSCQIIDICEAEACRALDSENSDDVNVCAAALDDDALATGALYADKQACEATGGGGKCIYVAEYTAVEYTPLTNRVCSAVTICHTDATQLQAETSTTDATCVCNDGFFGDGEVCEPWRQLCATVEGCEASGKQLCAQADLSAATVADHS